MRLKLDENLPARLVPALAALGHAVDTVRDEGLAGGTDGTVWQAAQADRRFFVTQDLDFTDVRRYPPGTHAGLLVIRLRDAHIHALATRVATLFAEEPVETWAGSLVIATERKVRVYHADAA